MSRPAERPEESLKRSVREELGIEIHVMEGITSVKHAYTHFRLTLLAYHSVWKGGNPRALTCLQWRWASPSEFPDLPFSRVDRKVMLALGQKR
jgi:A/G-specific adenine glycosylase